MKAKISRGGDFGGVLRYVHDLGKKASGEKLPSRVGGNMAGSTMRDLVSEFAATRALRPDCARPVWHCSLSLPESEHLSDARWDEITRAFMQEMELDPEKFLYDVRRHADTDHDHVHIVASRISLDSKLWHGQMDVPAAIAATQKIEQDHGLTLTPGFSKKEKSTPTAGELNRAIRTGIKPPRLVCQESIDAVLQARTQQTVPEFIASLQARGVDAMPNIASTGKMNGFSFQVEEIKFRGSKLGGGYSWAALQKRGVSYDKDRDAGEIADTPGRTATGQANADPSAAAPGLAARNSDASEAVGRDRASTGQAPEAATPSPSIVVQPPPVAPAPTMSSRERPAEEPTPAGPTWAERMALRRERKARAARWNQFLQPSPVPLSYAQADRRRELVERLALDAAEVRRGAAGDELRRIEHEKRESRENVKDLAHQVRYLKGQIQQLRLWQVIERAKTSKALRDAVAALESATAQQQQLKTDEKTLVENVPATDIKTYRDKKIDERDQEIARILLLEAEERKIAETEKQRREAMQPKAKNRKTEGWVPPSPRG